MDKPIEKKTTLKNRLTLLGSVGLVGSFLYFNFPASNSSNLIVDPQHISMAKVQKGKFDEYTPITGAVEPMRTVYLDLQEGGIVKDILIEGGTYVKKGDLVLTFSNSTLQKQNIDSETRLLENLDRLRNSEIAATEQGLLLDEQKVSMDYDIQVLEKKHKRYTEIMQITPHSLSKEQYEQVVDNLAFLKEKRKLLVKRIEQESLLRSAQQKQIKKSMILINRSLEVLETITKSLEVRVPISGYLSFMNAKIGQSFARGSRIGQIDQLDSFKVQANVDQYYISQVTVGQKGTFSFDGQEHELRVYKIYPEVENDTFRIDLSFVGEPAKGIKRGQTLQIDLQLSETASSTMVEKGGYFRRTNGRWVYLVSDDGMTAKRINIVSGRQNPKYYEILDGLKAGDRIVTSSYDDFGDAEQLQFSESLN